MAVSRFDSIKALGGVAVAVATRIPERADLPTFLGLKTKSLVAAVREGFPFNVYERVRVMLGLSARELAEVLSIPERTLQRRKQAGRLAPEESDRLLRLAYLVALALVVFEDDMERTARWLTAPKALLGGESPLVHADTEPGAREVEDMLYAIEFTMPA